MGGQDCAPCVSRPIPRRAAYGRYERSRRAIPVAGKRESEFPIHRFVWIGSAAACSLLHLLVPGSALDRGSEESIMGRRDQALLPAERHKFAIDLAFALLLVRLVLLFDKVIERGNDLFREPLETIATTVVVRQEPDVSTAKRLGNRPSGI